MKLTSYKELIVWQRSIELVKEVYRLTDEFPKEEIFGLTSQLRRAAISIPSCIAEGYMRKSKKEYSHFLTISLGSAAEIETQLIICKILDKFKHINFTKAESLNTEVLKMLYTMIYK